MRFAPLVLLLQLAVILVAARALGWLCARLHQPRVVGEMAAGILLGPSLLGWAAPGVFAAIFPPESFAALALVGQLGVVLYMFLVGLDFDPELLRGRGRAAVVTSNVSIVVPFLLGAALATVLYPRLSDGAVPFTGFALFMGAAMSVTAFPVLARILSERGLTGTRVGALALACAAVDDVSAWTILAVVVGIVRGAALERPLWLTVAGTAVFAAAMLLALRPALAAIGTRSQTGLLAVAILLLPLCAWTTSWLGVHAVFGAFALGSVLPRDPGLARAVAGAIERPVVVLLLPTFFAYTGLRTRVGLVSGAEMWLWAALILIAAVAGKLGGSALAGRATGLAWRDAFAVGVLMNTRGLMELVILSVGLDLGVISPTLFTMMVMMALITTAMTTPLLDWVNPAPSRPSAAVPAATT